jgi:hypothetical protein
VPIEIMANKKACNLKRILKEFARIKPTAPADFISRTFITTYINENTSNESFERLSWLSVATACRNASEVPDAKSNEGQHFHNSILKQS